MANKIEQPEKEAVSEQQLGNKNLWNESLGLQGKAAEQKNEETKPVEVPVEKKEENKPTDAPKGGDSESGGKKAPEVKENDTPEDPNANRLPDAEAAY